MVMTHVSTGAITSGDGGATTDKTSGNERYEND